MWREGHLIWIGWRNFALIATQSLTEIWALLEIRIPWICLRIVWGLTIPENSLNNSTTHLIVWWTTAGFITETTKNPQSSTHLIMYVKATPISKPESTRNRRVIDVLELGIHWNMNRVEGSMSIQCLRWVDQRGLYVQMLTNHIGGDLTSIDWLIE